ncbi:MAG: hypothetical protein LBE09_05280 [Christensenellaceae bacterium]|jgi:predicted  nucleic acid-binding Zn-ribbon protein|nr:hypothetical protein [Christensenellaceae bacterium]
MKLDRILKYQNIDVGVFKEEKNLASSETAKSIKKHDDIVSQMREAVSRSDLEAGTLFARMHEIDAQIENICLHERNIMSVEPGTLEQLETLDKDLNSYNEQLQALERDVRRMLERLQEMQSEFAKHVSSANRSQEESRKLNIEYKKMKEAHFAKFQKEYTVLKTLSAEIDPQLLAAYKVRRAAKKMPVFVPYSADSGCCPACGMQIVAEVGDKLKAQGDFAKCPNCERIVYLP